MTDKLRKAAMDVLKWHVTDTPARNSAIPNVYLEDLCAALAETPSIDALIAEIDGIERNEVIACGVDSFGMNPADNGDWIDIDELKAILDKYRARSGQ